LTPGRLTGAMASLETVNVTNPFGIESAKGTIDAVTGIGGFTTLFCAVAACVAIVVRYRGSGAEVRQQVRWLAFIAVAFFSELVIMIVGSAVTHDSEAWGNVAFLILFLTLCLAIPIAC